MLAYPVQQPTLALSRPLKVGSHLPSCAPGPRLALLAWLGISDSDALRKEWELVEWGQYLLGGGQEKLEELDPGGPAACGGVATTPVFLPGESLGQRNLAGYSPWGCKELDTTEAIWLACTLHLDKKF